MLWKGKSSERPLYIWRFESNIIPRLDDLGNHPNGVELSNYGDPLKLLGPNYNGNIISGWSNYSGKVKSQKMNESEMGYRVSKSNGLRTFVVPLSLIKIKVIFLILNNKDRQSLVKEQRVDGSCYGFCICHYRYISWIRYLTISIYRYDKYFNFSFPLAFPFTLVLLWRKEKEKEKDKARGEATLLIWKMKGFASSERARKMSIYTRVSIIIKPWLRGTLMACENRYQIGILSKVISKTIQTFTTHSNEPASSSSSSSSALTRRSGTFPYFSPASSTLDSLFFLLTTFIFIPASSVLRPLVFLLGWLIRFIRFASQEKEQEEGGRNQPFTFQWKGKAMQEVRFTKSEGQWFALLEGKVKDKGRKGKGREIKDLQDPTIHLSLQRGFDPCVRCSLFATL